MPVYAYVCTQCGNAFDARQDFSDAALTTCDTCGGALRKRYGTVGVTFSGSGFYRTDSRASEAKPTGESASKSGSDSASTQSGQSGGSKTSDSSSASKPAAKAPAASGSGSSS